MSFIILPYLLRQVLFLITLSLHRRTGFGSLSYETTGSGAEFCPKRLRLVAYLWLRVAIGCLEGVKKCTCGAIVLVGDG